MLHVAIRRHVKPGHEAAFEAAVLEFFATALHEPGTTGASLLRPLPGAPANEYGILRTFADADARDRFYASDAFRRWEEAIAEHVDGPAERRDLHGLEAFFAGAPGGGEPPRWKMALLTWVGVNGAVYAFAELVPRALAPVAPGWAVFLTINAFVVASLAWIIMPALTRVAGGWLRG